MLFAVDYLIGLGFDLSLVYKYSVVFSWFKHGRVSGTGSQLSI